MFLGQVIYVLGPLQLEVKSFSHDEAESIFRIYLGDETVERHRAVLLE
jgi:hypothetical protein